MTARQIRNYVRTLLTFRNGWELIRTMRGGPPIFQAKTWDGVRITHPPRPGLGEALSEVWIEQEYTDRFYEPMPGDVVLDLGANVGAFSLLVARMEPRCQIFAIEPEGDNLACLRENLAAAKAENTVVVESAVSSWVGHGVMASHSGRSLDFRLEPVGGESPADAVQVITLEQAVALSPSERIAFVKMDVEGAEHEIFQAAEPSVFNRIDRMVIGFHDSIRRGTLRLIRRRLEATHRTDVRFLPGRQDCGLLYAVRSRSDA